MVRSYEENMEANSFLDRIASIAIASTGEFLVTSGEDGFINQLNSDQEYMIEKNKRHDCNF